MRFESPKEDTALVAFDSLTFKLIKDTVCIRANCNFSLQNVFGKRTAYSPVATLQNELEMLLTFQGFSYTVRLQSGVFADENTIHSEQNTITLQF